MPVDGPQRFEMQLKLYGHLQGTFMRGSAFLLPILEELRMGPISIEKSFAVFAALFSKWAGSSSVFAIASISILAWAVSGLFFGYSAEWQLIVNTGTTICTFLMVFIIQNSQNRDGLALQIKLDEIIRALGGAQNSMIDLESLSHEELENLRGKFATLGQKARKYPTHKTTSASRKTRSTV